MENETKLTDEEAETIEKINRMSQKEMALIWRHAPIGHIYFDTTKSFHSVFERRFKELGGFTPEISKSIS